MKYKKILLFIICCFCNVSFCHAAAKFYYDITFPGEGEEDKNVKPIVDSVELSDTHTCHFSYYVKYANGLIIDAINSKGNSIIDDIVTPTESTKAGTSIKMSIVEEILVGWKIEEVYVMKKDKEIKWKTFWKKNNGTGEIIDSCTAYDDDDVRNKCGDFIDGEGMYEGTNISYGVHIEYGDGWKETTEKKYVDACNTEAKETAMAAARNYNPSASYNVMLRDPNDANESIDFDDEGNTFLLKGSGECVNCNNTNLKEGETYKWVYKYEPNNVCIGGTDGKVTYNKPCAGEQFALTKDEYFNYFIPLNVVDNKYSLLITPNDSTKALSVDDCVNAYKGNLTKYTDFLWIKSGSEYVRVRPVGNEDAFRRQIGNSGCYIRTEVNIPVSDGLYNIVSDGGSGNKINGFNFYFKTINEFDPFPNPVINKKSLWYDWYQINYNDGEYTGNGEPNIKKSFDKENKSYSLLNVNVNDIRQYNSKYSYLNNDLKINGKSLFVREKIDFEISNEDNNSFYKAGCGPLNVNMYLSDGKANPLYQKECK